MTTKIKICGLVRNEDAGILNENQVDFAGFVLFFPKSKRCLELIQAKEIMARLNPSIKKVAVTVSPTMEQVKQIESAGFDMLQVHGMLSEEVLKSSSISILRAINISDREEFLVREQSNKITGYVLDGKDPGAGQTFDWNRIKPRIHRLFYENGKRTEKQFMLAGGLYPENVQEAIRLLRPDIIDVSSGVELYGLDDRGRSLGKDSEKVKQFCRNVRKIKI